MFCKNDGLLLAVVVVETELGEMSPSPERLDEMLGVVSLTFWKN